VRATIEQARGSAPGETIEAVSDQLAIPTYAPDLAVKVAEVAELGGGGIYHVTSSGPPASWFELARASLEAAGLASRVKLVQVSTDERPRIAARPRNGVLQGRVAPLEGVAPARQWTEALREYVRELQTAAPAGEATR
jgi:dTDP-4-dehydrorhamnose reductase